MKEEERAKKEEEGHTEERPPEDETHAAIIRENQDSYMRSGDMTTFLGRLFKPP